MTGQEQVNGKTPLTVSVPLVTVTSARVSEYAEQYPWTDVPALLLYDP